MTRDWLGTAWRIDILRLPRENSIKSHNSKTEGPLYSLPLLGHDFASFAVE